MEMRCVPAAGRHGPQQKPRDLRPNWGLAKLGQRTLISGETRTIHGHRAAYTLPDWIPSTNGATGLPASTGPRAGG